MSQNNSITQHKKVCRTFFQNLCTTCSQKSHKLLMVFFATSHEHFQTTSPIQHLLSLYNFWIILYSLQLLFAISYLLLHYPTISMLMTFNSYLIRSTNAKISITILSTVLEFLHAWLICNCLSECKPFQSRVANIF